MPPRVARPALAGALAVAVGLGTAGCGLLGSGRDGSARSVPVAGSSSGCRPASTGAVSSAARAGPSAIERAERTHELPTPVPASASAAAQPGGWRSPAAAVTEFASVYVNWTAATVAARLRALAGASIGQARAELSGEAAEVAADRTLAQGGIANQGTVEAVARLPGGGERWIVVTRERTTSTVTDAYRGLQPQWHVSVATTARTGRGLWVLTAWQPES